MDFLSDLSLIKNQFIQIHWFSLICEIHFRVFLGLGVLAEASRRVVGINKKATTDAKLDGSLILNEANAERIVATLCKVSRKNNEMNVYLV